MDNNSCKPDEEILEMIEMIEDVEKYLFQTQREVYKNEFIFF
jgi:hypothetical protein